MNERIQQAIELIKQVLGDALRGGKEYLVLSQVEQTAIY